MKKFSEGCEVQYCPIMAVPAVSSPPKPRVWQPWFTEEEESRVHVSNNQPSLPTRQWREGRARYRRTEYLAAPPKLRVKRPHLSADDTQAGGPSHHQDCPLDMRTRPRAPSPPPPPPYSACLRGYEAQLTRDLSVRPSVITCAPPLSPPAPPENRRPGHRRELHTGTCDPVIDEHFRRSLGKHYADLFSSPPATGPPASAASTGMSVDDHFAKALGDTWLMLKDGQKNEDSGLPSRLLSI